jgi:hypothetical protein
MTEEPNAPVLAYATPGEAARTRRRRTVMAAVIGTSVGFVIYALLLSILASGGPIFPLTVVFSPLTMLGELFYPTGVTFVLLGHVSCVLLYGVYAAVVSWWGRRALIMVAVIHAGCFLATCWLRDALRIL